MAYENTHILMADAIRGALNERELQTVLNAHEDYYFLGAIFPDVLSYSRDKNAVKQGGNLHGSDGRPTNRIVFSVLDVLREHRDPKNFAFIAGYITHCAVDITLHPIIYYRSGYRPDAGAREAAKTSYLHWHFETIVDKRLNDRFYLEEVINPALIPDLVICRFIELPQDNIQAALKRQCRYFRINRRPFYYPIFRFLSRLGMVPPETVAGFYENLNHDRTPLPEPIDYKDPVTGEEKQTTLAQWKASAVETACPMLDAAWAYYQGRIDREECARKISGRNLATGRLGKTRNDIRFWDQHPPAK